MEVLVAIKNRSKQQFDGGLGQVKNVTTTVDKNGTIGDVAQALSMKLNIPNSHFMFIFCGKKLDSSTPVSSLFLGPQT